MNEMEDTMALYKEYETYTLYRLINKFCFCVLIFIFGCYLYVSTVEIMGPTRENKMQIFILLTIAWFISAFCIGFFQLLFDKDWLGIIGFKKFRNGYKLVFEFGRGRVIPVVWLDLIINRDIGKNKNITYNLEDISATYYNEGDRVLHLKGAKFLLRPDASKDEIICPMCAHALMEEKCPRCKIRFSIKDE